MTINFAEETINVLHDESYEIEDIDWIGCTDFVIPINEFFDAARRTDYNAGYGSEKMPVDLLIVMKDGNWFSRAEYDGSEWWRYNKVPRKPEIKMHIQHRNFNDPLYEWTPLLFEACVKRW
jgi:hypothetical protein